MINKQILTVNKIVIVSLLIILFAPGCKNHSQSKATTAIVVKAVSRNVGINKSNAYNDIFLDSTALQKFISDGKLNDTLSTAMRSFYNARNYEYAWFASTGLIEQAFSFHSLYCTENDHDAFNKSLEARLDRLIMDEDSSINANDPSTIKTELQITERFVQYALENCASMGIDPAGLGTYIPAKKMPVTALADSLLANNVNNKNYASANESFRLLKVQLQKYYTIAKNGGWPIITANSKKYALGVADPAIVSIKNRLRVTGEFEDTDTSDSFTPTLAMAVKTYQLSHGFDTSGVITTSLVKDMNISALARVQQLLINMQRMLWMPVRPAGKLIIVNIPEFEVYVDSGNTVLFQMDVVVGAQGHNTTMFSGNINQIVFSPYWDIPPSIVKKEVLPGIKHDKDYLEKRDMEITGKEGGLPVVRQRPGDKNALGKVKFLFPNSFNIYMHDSPEKQYFKKSERDKSHGCIRLSDAPRLAHFLLRNSETWTPEKIDSAMNSGEEQFVRLKNTVPVMITYYTAWVDNKGVLHFADDIYGHDKKIAQKMFTDPL